MSGNDIKVIDENDRSALDSGYKADRADYSEMPEEENTINKGERTGWIQA